MPEFIPYTDEQRMVAASEMREFKRTTAWVIANRTFARRRDSHVTRVFGSVPERLDPMQAQISVAREQELLYVGTVFDRIEARELADDGQI